MAQSSSRGHVHIQRRIYCVRRGWYCGVVPQDGAPGCLRVPQGRPRVGRALGSRVSRSDHVESSSVIAGVPPRLVGCALNAAEDATRTKQTRSRTPPPRKMAMTSARGTKKAVPWRSLSTVRG